MAALITVKKEIQALIKDEMEGMNFAFLYDQHRLPLGQGLGFDSILDFVLHSSH